MDDVPGAAARHAAASGKLDIESLDADDGDLVTAARPLLSQRAPGEAR